MPLDPQLESVLAQLATLPPMPSLTAPEARERFRSLNVLAAELNPPREVGSVDDLEIPGAADSMRARLYRPRAPAPQPTLVFIHGGGFVIGDIDSYDAQCRLLCDEASAAVLAFEYRLAPEDPFPAAVEDALEGVRWAIDHADQLGGDPKRLAVGGDSAGGNLAAVCAQELRGLAPPLRCQLLLYPVTDFSTHRPSVDENGEGLFLTRDEMDWFEASYLAADHPRDDPRVSPLLAEDLSDLPPAVIVTAELDPLRDDGEAYAEALEAAGTRVVRRRFEGLVHGFFGMGPLSESAERAAATICADLRALIG